MNLYLISQSKNTDYDTYDSAVVCAESETQAKLMHPNSSILYDEERKQYYYESVSGKHYYDEDNPAYMDGWAAPEYVQVKWIGVATLDFQSPCVICASFNAG